MAGENRDGEGQDTAPIPFDGEKRCRYPASCRPFPIGKTLSGRKNGFADFLPFARWCRRFRSSSSGKRAVHLSRSGKTPAGIRRTGCHRRTAFCPSRQLTIRESRPEPITPEKPRKEAPLFPPFPFRCLFRRYSRLFARNVSDGTGQGMTGSCGAEKAGYGRFFRPGHPNRPARQYTVPRLRTSNFH